MDDIQMVEETIAPFILSAPLPDFKTITQLIASKSITNPIKPNDLEQLISELLEHVEKISSEFKTFKEKLRLLQQIHSIPHLYLTAVAEVVSRRTFSHAFLM
ncbi:hypothetical protein J6590_107378, partial [Homalodisca vitripennis]